MLPRLTNLGLLRSLIPCALLLLLAPAAARGERESEPRLILPGSHAVRSGEVVELRWDSADAISELEILLSLDGGVHYSRCISPRLDPKSSGFTWHVPELGSTTIRMRIRFNRDGREIEGAPTAPVTVAPGVEQRPVPLGLPPAGVPTSEREPRPTRDRGDAPSGPSTPGSLAVAARVARSGAALVISDRSSTAPTAPGSPVRPIVDAAFAAPRMLPLRT